MILPWLPCGGTVERHKDKGYIQQVVVGLAGDGGAERRLGWRHLQDLCWVRVRELGRSPKGSPVSGLHSWANGDIHRNRDAGRGGEGLEEEG